MLKRLCLSLSVAAAVLFAPATVFASLIGDTVDIRWAYPDFSSTYASTSVVVGAGPEITCPGPDPICAGYGGSAVTFDIDASSITETHMYTGGPYTATAYNGFAYTSLDVGGSGILGVILTTNMPGLTPAQVSFGSDFVNINLSGLSFTDGSYYTLDLITGTAAV